MQNQVIRKKNQHRPGRDIRRSETGFAMPAYGGDEKTGATPNESNV